MLLNLTTDEFPPGRQRLIKLAFVVAGVAILTQILIALSRDPLLAAQPAAVPEGFGGYRQVGIALYTDYVLLVEMASLLLLAAIVGALILAKRKID
jgi:NADH-quinone oxidoreductase subunit J